MNCESTSKRINNKAVTLIELIIIIAVMVIIAVVAVVRIANTIRQSIIISEEAIVRQLTRAAINYNTAFDRWYGMTPSEDIFPAFLENPPPYVISSAIWDYTADGKNWKLNNFYVGIGTPVWFVSCPHAKVSGNKGKVWQFYVIGGKVKLNGAAYANHNW